MRNLLILAYAFPPQNTVGAARPFRFHKYLPEFGYKPYVITASDGGSTSFPNVIRVPEPLMGSYPARLIEGFLRSQTEEGMVWQVPAVRAARRLMKEARFDAILSTSPPVSTHLAAQTLARDLALPWVADFRDALVFNMLCIKRSVGRFLNARWERQIFEDAGAIIGVSQPMMDAWAETYPSLTAKMHLIYNGFDPEDRLTPRPIPARGHKLIAHVGGLYGQRTPAPALASFERLLAAGRISASDVKLELIGEIEPRILAACREQFTRLEALGFLKYRPDHVPRAEAVRAMAEADYLLVLDNNESNRSYGVPVKLIEYLQIGRPILAFTPEGSPPETMLGNSGIPHAIVRANSPAGVIDEQVGEFLRLSSDATPASEWFRQNFDGRIQAASVAKVLDGIVERR